MSTCPIGGLKVEVPVQGTTNKSGEICLRQHCYQLFMCSTFILRVNLTIDLVY